MTILNQEPAAQAQGATDGQAAAASTGQSTNTASQQQNSSQASTQQSTQQAGQQTDQQTQPAIEVKLPEGVEADPALLEAVKSAAKDGESAQALVDKFFEVQKAADERARAAWETQQRQWVEQLRAAPDIGGERWSESLQHAARAMQQFGSPELRKLLDDTGLGNHPELVKCFIAVGKALAEDTVAGTAAAAAPSREQGLRSLYTNSPELK